MSKWDNRQLFPDNAEPARILTFLSEFADHPGYQWFAGVIGSRIHDLEACLRRPIRATSGQSRESIIDLHNAHITEYETLKEVLEVVNAGIRKANESVTKGNKR